MSNTIVVTTTIRVPNFLKDLCKNAVKHNKRDISFIVIGDTKTPLQARKLCEGLCGEFRLPVDYFDIAGQLKELKDYPKLLEMMPLNSGARKMIGNFIAYLRGCTRLIMIDDDNFITDCDFFGLYEDVGCVVQMPLMKSDSGWYNVYESVIEEHSIPFYPRGYPWAQRRPLHPPVKRITERLKIIAKNGLVLEDPDVDAISRLFWPIRVIGMKPEFEPCFGLYPGTWSSFNNQHTAISYEAIPVYFTPPSTGRNADIWTAYVICRLSQHLKGVVAFGHPLVRQLRNPHNLWKDLDGEILNDRATDQFVLLLRSVTLSGKTYLESLGELIQKSLDKLSSLKGIGEEEREMMRNFFIEYSIWQRLFCGIKVKNKSK